MSDEVYVLVTPTRNNAESIGMTLAAVVAQTHTPARWVIVSDGSTDATDEIVSRFATEHEFIHFIRREPTSAARPPGPNAVTGFASKVAAFNTGVAALAGTPYDFIGNLDADVSFAPDYFERLLDAFAADPQLGLAGGVIVEHHGGRATPQRISANSVAGAVQLFRRQCFEDSGGFALLPLGGEDSSAEIMARARGWTVRTIFELPVRHHGRVGGRHGRLRARFNKGMTNYLLGYDPVFQAAVSAYRMTDRPYVAGGILMLAGYCWAAAKRVSRIVPAESVRFLRTEQRARLRGLLSGKVLVPVSGFRDRTGG